ncbi:hypothetical protein [Microbacterium sp. P05]|uniref:hypothetical protein n=1 Tax=Microbacterium sp. P05 TaxID=3366948 RepID=UPI0037458D83
MFTSITAKAAVAGVIAVALVGVSVTAAQAKAEVGTAPGQSSEEIYLWDGTEGSETLIPDNTGVMQWGQRIYGYPKNTGFDQYDTYFQGPAAATNVSVFLSNRGEERDTSKWISRGPNAFADPAAKTVLTPMLAPEDTAGTALANVKANGGDYSLGIAYTSGAGVTVEAPTFVHIKVLPGGNYTYEASNSTIVDPPAEGAQTADININAGVIEGDGALKLTVPTTSVTLDAPVINAAGLSEANGSITGIQVDDTRKTADRKGWNLTQSVNNFVSGANTIDKKNFGVTPMVINTTQGATPAAPQPAGSAVYPAPFASAEAGTTAGTGTTLSAGLKLIAPAGTPAGTYTSTMTLTLVSK